MSTVTDTATHSRPARSRRGLAAAVPARAAASTRSAPRAGPPVWPPAASRPRPRPGRSTPRSDGRPDHAGGRRHPRQGRGPVRQGHAPRSGRPDRAAVAAVCVYPTWWRRRQGRAGGQRRGRGQRRHRVPVRAGLARASSLPTRPRRGRRRRRRDRHGHRPRRVPGRALRAGLRRDRRGQGGLRHRAPEGDPGDRRAGHARQRPARVLAGDAGRRRLHQDLDRQGQPRPPRRR